MAKDITPEEAADKAKKAEQRVARKKRAAPQEPVQDKLKKIAHRAEDKPTEMTKKEKKIEAAKKAVDEAKRKLEKEQRKLDEAKAKDIRKQEKEVKKAKEALEKAKEKLRKAEGKKPMDLRQTAEQAGKNAKNRQKAGMDKKKGAEKGSNTEERVQQKKQEMLKKYDNKELPGGLIVKQEGPHWVLVGPNGRKEITNEMENFIKANRAIDKANRQIDANNNVSLNEPSLPQHTEADKKSMVDNTARGMSTGQMQDVDKVDVSVPVITDIENNPLNQAPCQKLAEVAVDYAMDQNDLDSIIEKDKRVKGQKQHEREEGPGHKGRSRVSQVARSGPSR